MRQPRFKKCFAGVPALNQPQRCQVLEALRYLPNYLGWRRALDGGRVDSAEALLRLAIGPIHGKG